MKYAALISTTENLGTIGNFVVNQLKSHFQNWSLEDPGSQYALQWTKGSLILRTDSSYLLSKWLNVETQCLNYLLDERQFLVAEQSEEIVISNAA